jgi:chromosome segregation ATPase
MSPEEQIAHLQEQLAHLQERLAQVIENTGLVTTALEKHGEYLESLLGRIEKLERGQPQSLS